MDDSKCGMIVILINVHREKQFHKNTIKIDEIMYMNYIFIFCVCMSPKTIVPPIVLCV
jgi:hypothetical protein